MAKLRLNGRLAHGPEKPIHESAGQQQGDHPEADRGQGDRGATRLAQEGTQRLQHISHELVSRLPCSSRNPLSASVSRTITQVVVHDSRGGAGRGGGGGGEG